MIVNCKGCGAQIMFVQTPMGRPHPVNLPGSKRWVKDPDSNTYCLTDTFVSHFSTCPQAQAFRKPVNVNETLQEAGKNLELYKEGAIRNG